MRRACWLIATGFGLGLLPRAPGTFGSLLGLALGAWANRACGLNLGLSAPTIINATAFVLGALGLAWLSIRLSRAQQDAEDDQRIVIDEVVGQAIGVMFAPISLAWYAAGFVLFRALDIRKPGPIGWADRRLGGALGVLADDVVAGIFTAAILYAADIAFR